MDALASRLAAVSTATPFRSGSRFLVAQHSGTAAQEKRCKTSPIYLTANFAPPLRHDTLSDAAAKTGRSPCGDNTTSNAYNFPAKR